MDALKSKTEISIHVLSNFRFNTLYVHLLWQLQQCILSSLIQCIFEDTVVEWLTKSDE